MDRDARDKSIKQEKLGILFAQSRLAVIYSLMAGVMLTVLLWGTAPREILVTWLGWLLAASLIRALFFVRLKDNQPQNEQLLAWEKPYFHSLAFASAVWGAGLCWLALWVGETDKLIIVFILMGMASGAVSTYAASRYMVLTSLATLLLPIAALFAIKGSLQLQFVAVGVSLFVLAAFQSTRVLENSLNDRFALSFQLGEEKERAEEMARTDHLTGIRNRGAITELAESQILVARRHDSPFAVILLDIDHFKLVNDTYGHGAGDMVLVKLASVLESTVRASDIVGRFGGEEFLVFLPQTAVEGALIVAENLRKAVAEMQVNFNGQPIPVTISAGVASNAKTLDELVHNADVALYEAKDGGRNQVRVAE